MKYFNKLKISNLDWDKIFIRSKMETSYKKIPKEIKKNLKHLLKIIQNIILTY